MSELDFLFGQGGLDAAATSAVWSPPASELAAALDLVGHAQTLGADAAFAAHGAGRGWLVAAGTVDLFFLEAVPRRDGTEELVRRHVLRVPEGGVLFALPGEAEAPRFLAVPSNGAVLVETTRQALLDLHQADDKPRTAAVRAIAGWVVGLMQAAVPERVPAELAFVAPGPAVSLEEGMPVGVQRRIAWLPTAGVAVDLPETEAEPGAARPAYLPLVPRTWVTPRAAAEVAVLDMPAWFATPDRGGDLDAIEAYATQRLVRLAQEEREASSDRLGRSREVRRAAFSKAMLGLAAVVSRRSAILALAEEETTAAAELIWQNLGIERKLSPAATARIAAATDKVTALSQESGLFVRKVVLSGDWWRSDHGPLLGHYDEGGGAVALLPAGRGGYRLVEPETGIEHKVDAATAKRLSDDAFSFAEPFPEGNLGARDLFGFGIRNGGDDVWIVLFMALLTGLLSMVTPVVTGWVMDPVIPEAMTNQLMVLIGALLVAGAAATGFGLVQSIAMLRLEGSMANRVQTAVWDRLLRLPASFFRSYSVGDLTNRADGVDTMRSMLTGTVTTSLLHAVSSLFSFAIMLWYSWRLALVTLLFGIIYAVTVILVGRRILSYSRETMRLTGQIQGLVLQLLNAVAKIRVAGAETSAFARWAGPYADLTRITFGQQRSNIWLLTFRAGFHFLIIAGVVIVLALQSHEFLALFKTPDTWAEINADPLHKIMPTASFVAFNVALGQFIAAVFGISGTVVKLAAVKPLYERVRPLLEAEPERETGVDDPGPLQGAVELNNLHFQYPGAPQPVLTGLSLSASPGEFIAIVGPSGAGKSTLIRLLLGFDTPDAGSVFLDGKDLGKLNKRLARRQFGVVLQDGRLLSGSLFHNITAGANLTRDDAMEAARLAGLDRDIEQMPMGLETYIGEGGSTLSGGQRQRLMIARAIVHRPRIIIFDEATSALDNETQAIVSKGLEGLHATRIVIAHRLSSIVHADRIFVLGGGQVAEAGTYDELMAAKGAFYELAKRQMV